MIAQLFLTLPAAFAATSAPLAPAALAAIAQEPDAEFNQRQTEAGTDVEKLWQLHLWCKETSRSAESRTVLKKIVELSPDHEDARKALGHHRYDNQWFETYTALAKYKRDEEGRMKEKGLARHKDQWIPIADLPFVRMGWTKDADGAWCSPRILEVRAQEAKFRADGWEQRREDSVWYSPEEKPKVEAGLWKCGEQWVSTEEANKYHAQIPLWWHVAGKHFTLNTTVDHDPANARNSTLEWALWWADETYPHLARIYGVEPASRPELTVLRALAQYNLFAGGDQASGFPGTEASGHSACHYAYFAETWFDGSVQPMEFRGQGVGYWDVSDAAIAPFGPFSVRHAAGLSYAEAIDPSLDTVSRTIENPTGQPATQAFWAEKKIPLWLRYGAAAYVERYLPDPSADAENQNRLRAWALDNLLKMGELLPLEQVFTFALDPNDQDGARRLISTAGLVVHFVVDGQCAPVTEKHEALKAALRNGGDAKKAVEDLQAALVSNADALTAFTQR